MLALTGQGPVGGPTRSFVVVGGLGGLGRRRRPGVSAVPGGHETENRVTDGDHDVRRDRPVDQDRAGGVAGRGAGRDQSGQQCRLDHADSARRQRDLPDQLYSQVQHAQLEQVDVDVEGLADGPQTGGVHGPLDHRVAEREIPVPQPHFAGVPQGVQSLPRGRAQLGMPFLERVQPGRRRVRAFAHVPGRDVTDHDDDDQYGAEADEHRRGRVVLGEVDEFRPGGRQQADQVHQAERDDGEHPGQHRHRRRRRCGRAAQPVLLERVTGGNSCARRHRIGDGR